MGSVMIVSWVLSAGTCLNIWLLGRKHRGGFLVGLAAQPVWLYFDYRAGAYGLMPLALILGYLYVQGYRSWRVVEPGETADVR